MTAKRDPSINGTTQDTSSNVAPEGPGADVNKEDEKMEIDAANVDTLQVKTEEKSEESTALEVKCYPFTMALN